MTSKKRIVAFVLFFCIAFMTIGWLAPALHATYAPSDQFIEVERFDPQNTTVSSDSHTICWERTVHRPASGDVVMEMYLLTEGGERHEVHTGEFPTYFEDRDVVSYEQPLPQNGLLEPGKYQYVMIVDIQLANGRVSRIFTWVSDEFYIKSVGANTTEGPSHC